MPPTIQDTFKNSPAFSLRGSLFYQNDFQGLRSFEEAYIDVRKKEGRLYSDDLVPSLPFVQRSHPLWNEWRQRAFTMRRLINHLKRRNAKKILEVGCGNGWLCHRLSGLPNVEVAGIDVNETELLQAVTVFKDAKNIMFIYGDILRSLPFVEFDYVILAASLQYFTDPSLLMRTLLRHLTGRGQIHIVDTPFYPSSSTLQAARRSEEYFNRHGVPEMEHHYHHHALEAISEFNPKVVYDPKTFLNKLRRRLAHASSFPWIVIDAD